MAIDDGSVPSAADFGVEPEQVLVRPYIGDYEYPDADQVPDVGVHTAPVPALRLAPRSRRIRSPVRVGRHRNRRPRVLTPRGRRRSVLLAAGAAAAVGTLAVGLMTPHTGGRLATPAWPTPTGVAAPDVPTRPGDPAQPGDPTAPGDPTQPTATPTPGPVAVLAPGAPPASPPPTTDPGVAGSPDAWTPTAQPDPSPQPHTEAATGQITNVAGLCLEGKANGGGQVRLWDCDGTDRQEWTLAADGTLRTVGLCVQPDTGLVRLRDCDGSPAQQWRTGPAGSLVNPASARCLGDPHSGTAKGTPQRTAPCDQSASQQWELPDTDTGQQGSSRGVLGRLTPWTG